MIFQKLTPTNGVELGIYKEAIDYALGENDIHNIAISGAYSSGKSSVLASYIEESTPEKNFLHISLAQFEDNNDNNIGVKNAKGNERFILEGKLLNQLLHKIDSKKIRLTDFRVKREIGIKNSLLSAVSIMLVIIILLHWFYFKEWCELIQNMHYVNLNFTTSSEFRLILGLLLITFVLLYVTKFVNMITNRKIFKKLSFYGNEIELFNEDNSSYFDKHLDEVIYLLNKVEADAIVFEDMDRFNDIHIFEVFREINDIVNSKPEKSNKPLKFLYLIRDDLFSTKDRTKFFDFIIPIIPVIDGSNTYSKLIEMLKENNQLAGMDIQFLKGVSVFIDDMRLMKNIYNEYLIYDKQLNITELSQDKLFAMVTYKNFFPNDYSELQLSKGYVYKVFENKSNVVHERKLDLQNELKEKRGQLSSLQNKVEEQNIGEDKDSLIREIYQIEKELEDIDEKRLMQLITKETEEKIFNPSIEENGVKVSFEDVKGNDYYPLLKYLIRNGYIDESYADYMTYFYEGDMKQSDKLFVRSVLEHVGKEYSYKILNPVSVIESLRIADFDQIEIMNYDLFKFLLSKKEYSSQRKRLIEQIADRKKVDFIVGFLESNPEMYSIVAKKLSDIWPENMMYFTRDNTIEDDFLWKWSLALLCNSSDEKLEQINRNGEFCEYIASSRRIIDDLYLESDRMLVASKIIDLKIVDLTVYTDSKPLNRIVSNDMYRLTVCNIAHIFNVLYNESADEYRNKPYSKLYEKNNTQIIGYVEKNMDDFVESIVCECNRVNDDYTDVINLLNNSDVDEESKKKYINILQTEIVNLADITKSTLWDELMMHQLVQFSDENIISYFEHNGMGDILVDYINGFDQNISLTDYDNGELFDAVISRDDISIEKYKQILVSMGMTKTDFNIPSIGTRYMDVLVENKIIEMNMNNLSYIRENYKEKLSKFILVNFEMYLECISGEKLEENEIHVVLDELFGNNLISENETIDFLNRISQAIEIDNNIYPDVIMLVILKNHLYDNDCEFLFSKYENYSNNVKNCILEIAKHKGTFTLKHNYDCSNELIKDYVISAEIDSEDLEEMLIVAIEQLPQNDLSELLNRIDLDIFCRLFDTNSRPRIPISNRNKTILDAFCEKGYIAGYSEDEKGEYYRIKKVKKSQLDRD